MYLTRIQLDLAKAKTMQALVAPKVFHGAIECAEPEGRTRKLWRLDTLNGNQYLLILTESPLDFSEVVRQFGTGTCAETKKYDVLLDRITNGSKWQFRLKANPVVYKKIAQSKRGKPVAHITTAYQEEWLEKQANLITKALATSVHVDIIQVFSIFRTETIANTVETLQV